MNQQLQHQKQRISLAMVSIKDTQDKAEPDKRGVHGGAAVWLMG